MVRKSMVITGIAFFVMTCLGLSPIYARYGNLVSLGIKGGADVVIEPGELVKGDLIAAGANVNLGGDFQRRLKAFGANVSIRGNVGRELVAAGANVDLQGNFQGKVRSFGANVVLAGTFEKDVEVAAARVVLTPTAVVKGNLVYAAASLDRQQGSQVLGGLEGKRDAPETQGRRPWREKRSGMGGAAGIIFWVISTAALVLAGILIKALFPGMSERTVAVISESPWVSLAVGLVFLVTVPLALVIAMITIVGIPVAVLAGFLYLGFAYVGRVFFGVWLGRKVMGLLKRGPVSSFLLPLIVGITIIGLIGLLPLLGGLFRVFCLLIGLGALCLSLWRSRTLAVRN
jgi:hypothetical protein